MFFAAVVNQKTGGQRMGTVFHVLVTAATGLR